MFIMAKDPNVQFRPNLCVYCAHFKRDDRKCDAFEITYVFGDKGPAPLSGWGSFEDCDKFQREKGRGDLHFFEGSTVEEAVEIAKKQLRATDIGSPTVVRERKEWSVSGVGSTEQAAVENAKGQLPATATDVVPPKVTLRSEGSSEYVAQIQFHLPYVILVKFARPWWKLW